MRELSSINPAAVAAERAQAFFRSDVTRPLAFRLEKLKALENSIRAHEARLLAALKEDLGKPEAEAWAGEIGVVLEEVKHSLKHLAKWAKTRRMGTPLFLFPSSGRQYAEPLGAALVISPWNYPVQLALSPLVGAISAGCTAVLKPSELAPASAAAVEVVLRQAFGDDGYISVVQGGVETSSALLEQKWDQIFFTGSTRVGQVVAEAAAKHLTPCVLELGGKSPCLVDEDTDLTTTARRIAWGKFYNAGQTCVAPDYVLVHKNVKAALLDQIGEAVHTFFGSDPKGSLDYGRIVTERHHQRLVALMNGGRVVLGGQSDPQTRYIAPTVLVDVDVHQPLMQEEIFGPLLPVIEVPDVEAALRFVTARPKPLALYVFTNNGRTAERVLERTSSGGAMVNDCMVHVGTSLPFGGVGDSGLGAYHGKASFDAFSHLKTVIKKPFYMDLKVRYPPYTSTSMKLLHRLVGG